MTDPLIVRFLERHVDLLAGLTTFPNVIVTGHQGFLTREALTEIAASTASSIRDVVAGRPLRHRVTLAPRPPKQVAEASS